MVFILKCTTYIRPYKLDKCFDHQIDDEAKNEFDRVILMRDLNDHIAREYKNLLDPTRNDTR